MSSQGFFLTASGLFSPGVLKQYLDDGQFSGVEGSQKRLAALRSWTKALANARHGMKEVSLEQEFNRVIFRQVLGYRFYPDINATAWAKPPSKETGIQGEPDIAFGRFHGDRSSSFSVVVELKKPGTALDAPQSRSGRKTPVEQAFDYAENILGVRWVIVTDMKHLRLYSVESRSEYEFFDLERCAAPGESISREFLRLYSLLHYDFLVDGGASSATSQLFTKSLDRQLKIRESFYSVYYQIRADLIRAIERETADWHPVPPIAEVLRATQRLLDRMLFLYYCEDHPNRLIPPHTIRDVTECARRLPGTSSHRVYDSLKALFGEVDK
ncbi:MAG: hypothetical protein IIC91_13500 [Chloroflexi bacterium]|nr:hypothetical protein [Chloroflexota bacterium]